METEQARAINPSLLFLAVEMIQDFLLQMSGKGMKG
jgi:hypothetical protein